MWRIDSGCALEILPTLPGQSVQCCVTSPPYWGLRDYGVSGQIGLETTPAAFVASLVTVFREVRRVLKNDGTVWLNLGDSYANDTKWGGQTSGKHARALHGKTPLIRAKKTTGFKAKDLVGIPWRVAFALQADGWYLRSDIIWAKPNPMPESVTDRPTKSHEYIFLLTKSARYYYDAEAVREPNVSVEQAAHNKRYAKHYDLAVVSAGQNNSRSIHSRGDDDGRNCRSVWTIATQPYPDAHFATFPEELPERCIKAGSRPGDTVLDPFCGAGTTGLVADRLGRDFIGIELNPAYREMARNRIAGVTPLFNSEQIDLCGAGF